MEVSRQWQRRLVWRVGDELPFTNSFFQLSFVFQLGKLKLHEIEVEDKLELDIFEKEKLEEVDKEEEQYAITVLEEKKAQMKPNMAAIAEYKKKVILY